MTKATAAIEIVIDGPKITAYLLNLQHPRGGPKAKYLLGFGFRLDDPQALAEALSQHVMDNLPGEVKDQEIGPPRIVFEGPVTAPDGRAMRLRTVWEMQVGVELRFITAVPLTR